MRKFFKVCTALLTSISVFLFIGYAQSRNIPNPSFGASKLSVIALKIADRTATDVEHIQINNNYKLSRETALVWLRKRDSFFEKIFYHFISMIEPKYSCFTEYRGTTWFHDLGIAIIKTLGCVNDDEIQNELLNLQKYYTEKNCFIKEEIDFLILPFRVQN